MTLDDLHVQLKSKFPTAVLEKVDAKPDAFFKIDPAQIHAVVLYMRDHLQFETLNDLCGVDYPAEQQLAVSYHVFSYTTKCMASLKVYLPRTDLPSVPSIADIYKAANWFERETYDMFGIRFENHPDLRRIMMPEDWVGYPLRKDFQTPDFYNGMPVPLYFDEEPPGTQGTH